MESEYSLNRKVQVVLAEYNDCRNEIKLRIQQRTQMTQFYIVGIVAIFGYAIQVANSLIWLIASGYAVFMYVQILGTYFYSDSLALYVREEIESKKIPHLLGEISNMEPTTKSTLYEWKTAWLGWETNYEKCLKEYNIIRRKRVLRAFTWGVVSISSICLGFGLYQMGADMRPATLFALAVVLVFGTVIEYISRKGYPAKQ